MQGCAPRVGAFRVVKCLAALQYHMRWLRDFASLLLKKCWPDRWLPRTLAGA